MLCRKFFVLEVIFVCSNVVPSLSKSEPFVLFCFAGIMRVCDMEDMSEGILGDEKSGLGLKSGEFLHQNLPKGG